MGIFLSLLEIFDRSTRHYNIRQQYDSKVHNSTFESSRLKDISSDQFLFSQILLATSPNIFLLFTTSLDKKVLFHSNTRHEHGKYVRRRTCS